MEVFFEDFKGVLEGFFKGSQLVIWIVITVFYRFDFLLVISLIENFVFRKLMHNCSIDLALQGQSFLTGEIVVIAKRHADLRTDKVVHGEALLLKILLKNILR